MIGYEERGVKTANGKIQKEQNKPKLNLTVREEQRNKLEQMASLENRSLSNLIEVMADERWKRLVDGSQQFIPTGEKSGLQTRIGTTKSDA